MKYRYSRRTSCTIEERVRAKAVELVLDGYSDKAFILLSDFYRIPPPRVRIGVKGSYKALGCYDPARRLICFRDSDTYKNPFIALHEFYHHLRSVPGTHRGTERHADTYALMSIEYYRRGCHLSNNT